MVPGLLLSGCPIERIAVTELNDDLRQFNLLEDAQINLNKQTNGAFDLSWDIPQQYQQLDVLNYLHDKMGNAGEERLSRLAAEWKEIQSRGMEPLIKTLIYIVDKFKESKTVWGVGRGSSCASYVLFLIGLHKVDPIKFGIPMTEFFHD